jgi:uncharacterized protein
MIKNNFIFMLVSACVLCSCSSHDTNRYVNQEKVDMSTVKVEGLLGKALESSRNGRLKWFIQDENSEAIRMYHHDSVKISPSLWYKGECAGKWLYAAALCVERTNDDTIKQHIRKVADFLVSQQEKNGYLGTYNDTARFCGNPVKPRQTYDLWMNGYVMQGLQEAYKIFHEVKYLNAIKGIADLCINTYQPGNKSIVNAGPFGGMGSACVMEHFVDLYSLTKEKKYLDFAIFCLNELDSRPGTEIVKRTLQNYDAAQINEGKMYEMLRCYTGIAKLYRITRDTTYLRIIKNAWNEVHQYHLNAAGAPCGGVGIHPECYNVRYMFTPYSNSETCALMAWMSLNIQLLQITGEAKYAEQLENAGYNALLGAQFPDGYGWIYHSVMNGARKLTNPFQCCPSSGTIAMEELPGSIYTINKNGININVYTPSSANLKYRHCGIEIKQVTNYPFEGKIHLKINPAHIVKFRLSVRIPEWATNSLINVNGKKVSNPTPGTYKHISRRWKNGDIVDITFPFQIRTKTQTAEYNEKGWYLDGKTDYTAIYRGPLLYSTERMDVIDAQNPILVGKDFLSSSLIPIKSVQNVDGQSYELKLKDQSFLFVPYFEVGNRIEGSYHAVWLRK